MSKTFERIKELVKRHEIKVSDHGYDEIAEDDYDKETSYKTRTRR